MSDQKTAGATTAPKKKAKTTSLAETIKLKREAKKLTQAELAKSMGVSVQTVSSLEKGKTTLTPDRFKPLSKALKIGQNTLMDLVVSEFKTDYTKRMKSK